MPHLTAIIAWLVVRYIIYTAQKTHKLAPYGTDGRRLLTANFKVTWHKNWEKNQTSGPEKLYVLCSNLRISGNLPVAPIVNRGGDVLWKWSTFRLSRAHDLDLDLGSRHTAYHHASLVDLYLHTKFHWNRRNVLWTDGRTDVWTDGQTFETGFIRLTRRSRPNKWI